MIYLMLFLTFLKIGAASFGGGFGMISLIREDCLANGWLTEEELLNFIAVAESTPGPIAVNMATFVGSSQGGILGAFLATLGVVLPSFVIILLIAAVFNGLLKYAGVKA
ncbi:MAG: chromate transporter, partial [Clostridia bacterium]|nr:chromate transporter [Clostridia bacterium]